MLSSDVLEHAKNTQPCIPNSTHQSVNDGKSAVVLDGPAQNL